MTTFVLPLYHNSKIQIGDWGFEIALKHPADPSSKTLCITMHDGTTIDVQSCDVWVNNKCVPKKEMECPSPFENFLECIDSMESVVK